MTVRREDTDRGPRIVIELGGEDHVLTASAATALRDALTRELGSDDPNGMSEERLCSFERFVEQHHDFEAHSVGEILVEIRRLQGEVAVLTRAERLKPVEAESRSPALTDREALVWAAAFVAAEMTGRPVIEAAVLARNLVVTLRDASDAGARVLPSDARAMLAAMTGGGR